MKMQPPAIINKQVTEDMLHWIMMQPNTVTLNKTKGEYVIAPGKTAQDYPVDDRTKDFMLFELQKILEYNGFKSELLDNGNLRISKDYWSMDIDGIREQLPFPDYLPHQIEKAYKHQHENNLYSSQKIKTPRYDYPSRELLESIKQTIIDNTEGDL